MAEFVMWRAQTLVGWLASLVAVRLVDGRYSQDTKVKTNEIPPSLTNTPPECRCESLTAPRCHPHPECLCHLRCCECSMRQVAPYPHE